MVLKISQLPLATRGFLTLLSSILFLPLHSSSLRKPLALRVCQQLYCHQFLSFTIMFYFFLFLTKDMRNLRFAHKQENHSRRVVYEKIMVSRQSEWWSSLFPCVSMHGNLPCNWKIDVYSYYHAKFRDRLLLLIVSLFLCRQLYSFPWTNGKVR